MDHSFHLLNSVQSNLLRHLHAMNSTIFAHTNILSLSSNEIWIINVNSPQQKYVPILMFPHHGFIISNNISHYSVNVRSSMLVLKRSYTENTLMLKIQGNKKDVQCSDYNPSTSLLYFAEKNSMKQYNSHPKEKAKFPIFQITVPYIFW